MKRILIIDNYDSFTFNLVQYVEELDSGEVVVVKNDRINLNTLKDYDAIIISPGPGLPKESGQLMQVFDHLLDKPVLGVCLGHQAIGEYFGAKLLQLEEVYHGVDSNMIKTETEIDYPLFHSIATTFRAGRYHSWVVEHNSIQNSDLVVTCHDEKGIIMGLRHKKYQFHGVQFHPESIMTPDGRKMISNFLQLMHTS